MANKTTRSRILRIITTLTLIIVGIFIMILLCLVGISAPCISNFYDEMPQYPSAEIVQQNTSTLNWVAIGLPEYVGYTADDSEVVRAWFEQNVNTIPEMSPVRITNDDIAPAWDHNYTIMPLIDGTEIRLEAKCFN
ncbi:MAG: hypothetical protein Phog2KO_46490 [Phototrophicaceae bacterium]